MCRAERRDDGFAAATLTWVSGASTESVAAAYDEVAELYTEMFRDAMVQMPFDRAALALFAELVPEGLVADVGCGPGRITGHLDSLGLNVFGLDASAEMIRFAREIHPHLRFEHRSMTSIDAPDCSLSGIVAWYSIIHMPPEQLPEVFAEFGRALAGEGLLQLAFQAADDGADMQPYDHRVAPCTRWSPERLEQLVRPHGFVPVARMLRQAEGTERTPQGYLLVRKSQGSAAASADS